MKFIMNIVRNVLSFICSANNFRLFVFTGLLFRALPHLSYTFKFFHCFYDFFPYVVILWSLCVIVYDFFNGKSIWNQPFTDIKCLFILSYIITCVVNYKYNFYANMNFTFRLSMQLLLISYFSRDNSERNRKNIKILSMIYIGFTFFASITSIVMFFCKYGTTIRGLDNHPVRTGFIWDRLFGIYQDPNYGALFAVLSIIVSVYFITATRLKTFKIFLILNIVTQYYYIIMSYSRSGSLCLALSVILMSFWFIYKLAKIKKYGTVLSVFCSLVLALVTILPFGYIQNMSLQIAGYNSSTPSQYTKAENVAFDKGTRICNMSYSKDSSYKIKDTSSTNKNSVRKNSNDISNQRFDSWKDQLRIFMDKPVFGVSVLGYYNYAKEHYPNSFIIKNYKFNCENDLLRLLVYSGLSGTVIMFVFLFKAANKVYKYLRNNVMKKSDITTLYFMIIVLCVLAFDSIFLNTVMMNLSVWSIIFWTLIGYLLSLCQKSTRDTIAYRVLNKLRGEL